jgi:hypothetical protein
MFPPFRAFRAFRAAVLSVLVACGLDGCAQVEALARAKPAPVSGFLGHPGRFVRNSARAPFHRIWSAPDPAVHRRAMRQSEIYVAPVTTRFLRPIARQCADWESANLLAGRREAGIAQELQAAFVSAFHNSPRPRYRVAHWPTRRSLTLELALVELNPTCVTGNVAKKAAGFVIGPLAGLGGFLTKGNIAIEGRVINSLTRETVFEFADNESDKVTFYSLRDYQPYAHAREAIAEWAAQFEELSRTPPGHTVKEAEFWTLLPW